MKSWRPLRHEAHVRYLCLAEQLEERTPPRLARNAILLSCTALLAAVLWAAMTMVPERATATGKVVPAGSVRTVQHLEGGIVTEILIREGDVVKAGMPLARFAATASTADLEQLRVRKVALALRSERLRAFADGRVPDYAGVDADHLNLVRDQELILRLQNESRMNQRAVQQAQLSEKRNEAKALESQIAFLRQQVESLRETMELRTKLNEKGLSSRVVLLDAQRELARAQGQLAEALGGLARGRDQVATLQQRVGELDSRLASEALTEMGQVEAEMAQVRESLLKQQDRVKRLTVTAPVEGLVKSIDLPGPGTVLAPGQTLFQIVPLDGQLLVEMRINPRDIGNLHIGQPAFVRVSAFDFLRHGGIDGAVEHISASTFEDEAGRPYYKGLVKLDRQYLGEDPGKNRVLPSMTVEADIHTGERSILQYLLKPIYASLALGLRER